MRKFRIRHIAFLFLAVPGCLWISCDKDEISESQASSFIKYYGAGMKDAGMEVLSLEDGYLIMANIEDPDRGQDICIIRTDRFGNTVQDPVIIGGRFNDHGARMKANESGFVIAGSTRQSDHGETNAYIVQIDPEATEVLWEIDTGFSMDDEALDIYIHDNGDIAVCGYSEIDREGKNVLLIELHFVDDTMQVSLRDYGLAEDEVAHVICRTNNRYLFAGYASMPAGSTSAISSRLFALKWDGTSDLGEPSYRIIDNNYNSEIVDIVKTGEDEFYIACRAEHTESEESFIQIAQLSSSPWHWEFPANLQFGERTTNHVSQMQISGDRLTLCGTSSDVGDRGDMFVMETDLNGTAPVYRYRGDGISYEAEGFDHTGDGGFIMTGAVYTSQQSAVAVFKLGDQP